MNKVICFGEALIDFLNTGSMASGPLELNDFRQFPGGAPANAAVAVAKLGGNASFLGQVGDDIFGHFLEHALNTYHVDTQYLFKHPTAKTALAFVILDEHGERSFSFHRNNSADVVFSQAQLPASLFSERDILHFCSNTLTEQNIAETTRAAVQQASQAGALVSFDVNLRHNLWAEGQANIALVKEFVALADVLKFSREEIDYLAEGNVDNYISDVLSQGCQLLVVTNDGDPIHYYSQTVEGIVNAPKVKVVDTTAGGDAFSGGLLFQLSQISNFPQILDDHDNLSDLISFAARCGAVAVTSEGAFPALPQFENVSRYYPQFLLGESNESI